MIIVTGGAGFIGSNLVKGLNQMGEEKILIVDHLSNASKHLNLNRLRYSDYLDKELLLKSSITAGTESDFSSGRLLGYHRIRWALHDGKQLRILENPAALRDGQENSFPLCFQRFGLRQWNQRFFRDPESEYPQRLRFLQIFLRQLRSSFFA